VRRLRVAALLSAACATGGLAGCGASKSIPGDRVSGDSLTIYSSLPFHGPSSVSARAVLDGERLALTQAGHRVGRYRIVLRSLDDSTVQRSSWDPGQTTIDARIAIRDATTIGYIGDLNSGASAIALPVLNRLGIPQVSPASTAVGLTTGSPGASPGEPQKYYPTRIRTYARVMPSDGVQARVQVQLQRAAGCRHTFVVDDGEVDGEAMATSFQLTARATGLDVIGVQSYEPRAADYRAFANAVAQTKADCVLISAITDSGAVAVTKQLAQAMPGARIFATAGLAESSFADPGLGGVPGWLDSRVTLTGAPPGLRPFYTSFTREYGDPEPDAIYGYEAMSLLLGAISRATKDGRRAAKRSAVRDALFDTRERRSVLGTYSIESTGNTTLGHFGVYRIVAGQLRFWRNMDG
jgi:branched-chain amino acid transport system substrate-binding protein